MSNKDYDPLLAALDEPLDAATVESNDPQKATEYEEALVQLGAAKGLDFSSRVSKLSSLRILLQIKKEKKYKERGLNWSQFLERHGMSRSTIDKKLADMEAVGEEAYAALVNLGIQETQIRLLANSSQASITAPGEGEAGDDIIITHRAGQVNLSKATPQEIKDLCLILNYDLEKESESKQTMHAELTTKQKYLDQLRAEVSKENELPKSILDLQDLIANLQMKVLLAFTEMKQHAPRYMQDDNLAPTFEAGVAWFGRMADQFLGITDPEIVINEDPMDTSFLNQENRQHRQQ